MSSKITKSSKSKTVPKLTKDQQTKLEYYFKFFDGDGNKILEFEDLQAIMDKILAYTGWKENSPDARECYEVHHVFFEVMREKAEKEQTGGKIGLNEWFDIWEKLLPGCKGMGNFPIWLRRLPTTLFKIIDFNGDGYIDEEELCRFYVKMVNIDPEVAKKRACLGMKQMTDNNRYILDSEGFEQIFANFLIGRTLQGPGRHAFGCFEDHVVPFKIIKPTHDDDEEEDKLAAKNRRRMAQHRGSIDQRVKVQYNA